MKNKTRKNLGALGEKIALRYYQEKGWEKIDQNCWTRYGELDLLLRKKEQIMVVEVKTRRNKNFGWGEESINAKKLKNIHQAYAVLKTKKSLPDFFQLEICVIYLENKKAKIKTFLAPLD